MFLLLCSVDLLTTWLPSCPNHNSVWCLIVSHSPIYTCFIPNVYDMHISIIETNSQLFFHLIPKFDTQTLMGSGLLLSVSLYFGIWQKKPHYSIMKLLKAFWYLYEANLNDIMFTFLGTRHKSLHRHAGFRHSLSFFSSVEVNI